MLPLFLLSGLYGSLSLGVKVLEINCGHTCVKVEERIAVPGQLLGTVAQKETLWMVYYGAGDLNCVYVLALICACEFLLFSC